MLAFSASNRLAAAADKTPLKATPQSSLQPLGLLPLGPIRWCLLQSSLVICGLCYTCCFHTHSLFSHGIGLILLCSHCSLAALALLSHCSRTALALLSHCCHTALTLLSHCFLTARLGAQPKNAVYYSALGNMNATSWTVDEDAIVRQYVAECGELLSLEPLTQAHAHSSTCSFKHMLIQAHAHSSKCSLKHHSLTHHSLKRHSLKHHSLKHMLTQAPLIKAHAHSSKCSLKHHSLKHHSLKHHSLKHHSLKHMLIEAPLIKAPLIEAPLIQAPLTQAHAHSCTVARHH